MSSGLIHRALTSFKGSHSEKMTATSTGTNDYSVKLDEIQPEHWVMKPNSPEHMTLRSDYYDQSDHPTRMEDKANLRSARPLSKEKLNVLWTKSSEESKEKVLAECEKICAFIKTKSKSILCVYPVYDIKDDRKVQFVVITEKKIRCPRNINYDVVMRSVNDCSGESMAVQCSKKITRNKYSLTTEKRKHMRDVINRNAPGLMKRYKYVSVISGSNVRSKDYDTKKHKIIPQPCIVIYVHTKNKIPLSEGKLPKLIENIPVDVREGSFQNSSSDRYRKKLLMGSQITSSCNSESFGTLGGFIDHPLYGLCGVTCAHVLLSVDELNDVRKEGTRKWEDDSHYVYQPAVVRPRNCVGPLRETCCKQGDISKPGVDLAVFQIQERPPDSGKFPEGAGMLYETGRIEREIKPHQYSVVKFGQTTSKTDGIIQFKGAAVRKFEFTEKYLDDVFTYTLFDQIEIRPPLGKDIFSDAGDSGALVFTTNVSKELACIGMVVGNLNVAKSNGSIRRGNSIVTPVSAIQDELGISEFKSFVWNRIENMEERFTSIDRRLGKLDKMDTSIKNMEKIIKKIASRR